MENRKNVFLAAMEANGFRFVPYGGCKNCEAYDICDDISLLTQSCCSDVCLDFNGHTPGYFVRD